MAPPEDASSNQLPNGTHTSLSSTTSPTDAPPRRTSSTTSHIPALTHRTSSLSSASASATQPSLPARHPRPMTPAELHLELEKEQEAIVNRLQRDLSALRAHSASLSSTSSSAILETPSETPTHPSFTVHHPPTAINGSQPTSSSVPNSASREIFPLQSGPTHPTPSRRHRSSSSVSGRSAASSISISASTGPLATLPPSGSAHAVAPSSGVLSGAASQASVDRARDAAGQHQHQHPPQHPQQSAGSGVSVGVGEFIRSRGNSYAVPSPGHIPASISRNASFSGPSSTRRRDEAEAERARADLATAKAENDALIERVRELERLIREQVRGGTTS